MGPLRYRGGVAQRLEHPAYIRTAPGSNPGAPTSYSGGPYGVIVRAGGIEQKLLSGLAG